VGPGHYYIDMERRVRFELLYAKHAPAVKAYLLRRARSSIADDLLAEVFVVCWRRFDEVPPEVLPWLLGVARRVLSTHRRSEARGLALREQLIEVGAHLADAPATIGHGVLTAALRQVNETDRELLMLIAWEGLAPAEAAAVLEVRPGTVRVRLHRARRRLASALEREEQGGCASSHLPLEVSP
jgi:RNA polymerase sigma-70 factor (ECF subfamily)